MVHTRKEKKVVRHLAEAWNAFLALPIDHIDQHREFRSAIHDAQRIIAIRLAARVDPKTWPRKTKGTRLNPHG